MVNDILNASGVQHRRGRFLHPPRGTYAVFFDNVTTDGPDEHPEWVENHDVMVELYEPAPDDAAEADMEAAISAAGLEYEKQDRFWLQTEQMYQVIYEFSYIKKRRT